jgi:hypothetical protein
MDNSQSALQTPTEEVRIAGRDDNAWPAKTIRRCDQALNIQVGFTYCVPEVAKPGSIACNSTLPLYDKRSALTDAVAQFAAAGVAVHSRAYPICGLDVAF